MAQRSQFLALLDQSGWVRAEMSPSSGRTCARLERSGRNVEIELTEGATLLCKLRAQGDGAREMIASMRAQEGAFVELNGPEQAWGKALEALFAMKASNVVMAEGPLGGPKMSGGVKIGGAPAGQAREGGADE